MRILSAHLLLLVLSMPLISCASQTLEEKEKTHPAVKVKIKQATHDGCSFLYSPVNFCDEKHIEAVTTAIKSKKPNFNSRYILLTITERSEYFQKSIVAIDPSTGLFYPLPIDAYSGTPSKSDPDGKNGKISFDLDSNEICIEGDILVYRSITTGNFCFYLKDEKFIGHTTAYMN